jgi:hypothetical protein
MFLTCVYHWFSRQEGHHSSKKSSMGRQRLTQPALSSPLLSKVPEIARHECCPTQEGFAFRVGLVDELDSAELVHEHWLRCCSTTACPPFQHQQS